MHELRIYRHARYLTVLVIVALLLVTVALAALQRHVESEVARQRHLECEQRRLIVEQQNRIIGRVARDLTPITPITCR